MLVAGILLVLLVRLTLDGHHDAERGQPVLDARVALPRASGEDAGVAPPQPPREPHDDAGAARSRVKVIRDGAPAEGLTEEGREDLERIKTFFVGTVVDQVRPCFEALPEGVVEFAYDFASDGAGSFTIEAVEISDSNLEPEHDAAALACMTRASVGAAIGARSGEQHVEELHVVWLWPMHGLPPQPR